jgi:catecholate siderophore receptor
MSCKKVPATLRRPSAFNQPVERRGEGLSLRVGALAAACIVSSIPIDRSLAQTAAPTGQLPQLTVEAPAEVKKRRPARQGARRRTTATPTAAGTPGGAATETPPSAAAPLGGANPYADPAAPYKVDRSASTKLTEPLLNTPRSVTAIPKEVIEDKASTSLRDLVRTTPGLTLGTGEGGNAFGDRVFIRGFDARNDIYVDGLRDSGVNIRENFGTEQVEIVKGPSGSIGGRGTTGGAINVVTKKPTFDKNFVEGNVTFGTDKTKRTTADVNRAITPELAVRANAMWQNADVAGRDYVFDDRWGALIGATYKPNEIFKATVDYYHLKLDQLPDWGVPFDSRIRMPFTESGVDRSNYYGIPARDFQKATQDIATGIAEVKFSENAVLSNKTRYGFSVLDYVVGAPGNVNTSNPNPANWTVTSSPKSRYQENEILANQTDFTAKFETAEVKHTVVTGLELSREKVTRDTYQQLSTESFQVGNLPGTTLNLFNPNAGAIPWSNPLLLAGRPTTVEVDTKSAYALDTLNFYERVFVTGGVRLDDYDISARSIAASGAVTDLSRHDLMFNWNLGVTYKPLPIGAIYAAYGTSTNPVGSELDGGGNDYGALTAQNATLGPEKNTSIEVGTKWELFDRHLLATAALFQNTKANARETVGGGAAQTVQASGEYVVRGIDIGVSGKITPWWSVFGGVVLMRSEVTESAIPANIGRKLANIAHESLNLLTKYDVTDHFTIGGQATYKSKIYGGTLASNDNVLPAGWRFDALAEYRFTKNVSAKLNVINITNAVLYDAFYRSNVPYVYLAPGRAAYLTLTGAF